MASFINVNVGTQTKYIVPGIKTENIIFGKWTGQTLTVYLPLATPVNQGGELQFIENDSTFNSTTSTIIITTQRNQSLDGTRNGNITIVGDGSNSYNIANPWLSFYSDGSQWISNHGSTTPATGVAAFGTVIPWTTWNYFVLQGSLGGDFYWNPASAQNGTGFTGTPNRDYGTATFTAPVAGTYQFTFPYLTDASYGIATFTINSVATTIDTYYAGNLALSYVWSQVLPAGTYTIDLSSLTKNSSSSNYWLVPLFDGLAIKQIA